MSQILGRGLDLLSHVVRSSKPLSVMEAAASAGLDKSTASRLLAFLEARQYLHRDPATRCYSVGPELLWMGAVALRRCDVRTLAVPHMERLRDVTGETVSLHLRRNGDRVCVDARESPHPVRGVVPIGEPIPLYSGPSGIVILAHLPPETRTRITDDAEKAGVDVARLHGMLERALGHGYLTTVGARVASEAGLSVPIFDSSGVIASVTVSGPAERWTLDAMHRHAPSLIDVAEFTSRALGGKVRRPPETRDGGTGSMPAGRTADVGE